MNATPFMDYDMHGHGASHWQVSSDSTNYTNSIVDRWVQYKNLFKDQDSQEGIDLNKLNIKRINDNGDSAMRDLFLVFLGVLMVYFGLFGIGYILYNQMVIGVILLILSSFSFIITNYIMSNN